MHKSPIDLNWLNMYWIGSSSLVNEKKANKMGSHKTERNTRLLIIQIGYKKIIITITRDITFVSLYYRQPLVNFSKLFFLKLEFFILLTAFFFYFYLLINTWMFPFFMFSILFGVSLEDLHPSYFFILLPPSISNYTPFRLFDYTNL